MQTDSPHVAARGSAHVPARLENAARNALPQVETSAYVGGAWVEARSGDRFAVTNPATGETIAHVPDMSVADVDDAVSAAGDALTAWRRMSALDRGTILRDWAELMRDSAEGLAITLVREQGKPIREAVAEIGYAASFLDWFAEEARRSGGTTIPSALPGRRMLTVREPFGIGAAITPWNFPAAMITRKVAPALAAGNTLVVKPAEQTPLSALALARLAERAGLPPGVLNIVTSSRANTPTVGHELSTRPEIRKLSFTGSTAIGALLMSQASATIKSLSLELGGNAPFLVFADANLDLAVEGLITAKFRNAGQTCISANRVLVADVVYTEFAERLTEQVSRLVVGDGLDPATSIGPLIDAAAVAKFNAHVADAQQRGATVRFGGNAHPRGGNFVIPTVLTDCPSDADLCREETFGPLAAITPFTDEAEAITLANATVYGLASYAYTQNADRAWRLADALETGMLGINTAEIGSAAAPFGGVKQSGIGREGAHEGFLDWTEEKYLCWAINDADA
jgi:succinate-semialdehyde dehydrogenase/glutarate-semialdehyde dehydrogenase